MACTTYSYVGYYVCACGEPKSHHEKLIGNIWVDEHIECYYTGCIDYVALFFQK